MVDTNDSISFNNTISVKGLVRSTMLMEYIRINALFYGQKHVSSGLYVVTAQEDSISKSGYRTTLTLLRIAGDDDYITKATKTVTRKAEQVVLSENNPKLTGSWEIKAVKNRTVNVDGYDHTYTDEDGNTIYVFTDINSYRKAMDANREWFIPLVKNLANLLDTSAAPSGAQKGNITAKQFVQDMKYLALSRATSYRTPDYDGTSNTHYMNCGYIWSDNGTITIGFDGINMIKSYINEPDIVVKTGPMGYFVQPGTVISGNTSIEEVLNECTGVTYGDFSNCVPGSMMYMTGHAGVYVGEFTSNGKTYNAVECTAAWEEGVILTWVDANGTRRHHKGDANSRGIWLAWGKLSGYIKY